MIAPIEVSPSMEATQIKTVVVTQSARKQLVFRLTDDHGQPVNLLQEVENPPAPAPDWTPEKTATGANVTILLRVQPQGALYGSLTMNVIGTPLDQTTHKGFVQFELFPEHTGQPGIFEAWIERQVPGPFRVDTWPVLLQIQPPTLQLLSGNGPLLIPEVRLALLDMSDQSGGAPFSNLLDDTEFRDLDIVFSMRRIVQKWNETPPPVVTYTPQNFPYRYWWLEGTCGLLLIMSAERYRRNALAYQAGGVAIRDQDKAEQYEAAGRRRLKEFDEWMRREKVRINMGRAWSIGI